MQTKATTTTRKKEFNKRGLQELLNKIQNYKGGGLKEEATFIKDIASFFDHVIAGTIGELMDAIGVLDDMGKSPVPLVLEAEAELININDLLFDGSYEMVRIEETSMKVTTSSFNDYVPIKVKCIAVKPFNSNIWMEIM